PARDVEAGPELQPVEQAQDPVDPDAGAAAPLLEVAEAPPPPLAPAGAGTGLGVEVEGQDCGGLLAVGPAVAHRDLPGSVVARRGPRAGRARRAGRRPAG